MDTDNIPETIKSVSNTTIQLRELCIPVVDRIVKVGDCKEVFKILSSILFLLMSIILPVSNKWFILSILIALGNGYQFLWKRYPRFMTILSFLVRYQVRKICKQLKLWINVIAIFFYTPLTEVEVRFQTTNNINSLVYYDKVKGNDKKYIYLFHDKLRSNDLVIFKDENNSDITEHIEPYLGPLQNFHGVPFTPRDFNHKQINVFRDGDICLSKTFEEDQVITFE